MSKKSRRRNKRLLMLAALAGGAAMMGRGKKKFGTDAGFLKSGAAGGASLAADSAVTGVTKPTAPVDNAAAAAAAAAAADTGSQTKYTKFVDGKWRGPNEIRMLRAQTAGNQVPPSMRSGAAHAEGYQRRVPGGGRQAPSWIGTPSLRAKGGRIGAKKGGSVTGIAKRGFGRALMKGKK